MKRARLQAATLGGSPDEVEQAFYEALRHGDLEQLMACWAEEDEVVCIHPGGQRLIGAGAIRAGFEALFANGSVQVSPERVRKINALASAVHHLVERITVLTPQGEQMVWVTATNVYQQTPQGWRMVAHHACPASTQESTELQLKPTVLH